MDSYPSPGVAKRIEFQYDALGNRVAKHLVNGNTNLLEKSTYYVLDASGNVMNTYDYVVADSTTTYELKERQVYDSSRLGTANANVDMLASPTVTTKLTHALGFK